MIAYGYDVDGYYTGEKPCQIDPLESRQQGKDIWLLPANSTFDKPLPAKSGFKVKFQGGVWTYEPIPQPEPEPEPTQEQKEFIVRGVRNAYLAATDFTQLADAPLSKAEKASYAEYRQYLRDYTESTDDWFEQEPLAYEDWKSAE